jgi:predicted dehydrogenase
MGRRHLRGMAALLRSSACNMELAAVCDLKREPAELLADEARELLGTRPPVFTDLAEMVRAVPDLEAADVTVESGFHHAVAVACLQAGLHVLCEKPLAVTVRGCNLVIETARRAGRILSVAENFRRDPIRRLARALIEDGAIGTPRVGAARPGRGLTHGHRRRGEGCEDGAVLVSRRQRGRGTPARSNAAASTRYDWTAAAKGSKPGWRWTRRLISTQTSPSKPAAPMARR